MSDSLSCSSEGNHVVEITTKKSKSSKAKELEAMHIETVDIADSDMLHSPYSWGYDHPPCDLSYEPPSYGLGDMNRMDRLGDHKEVLPIPLGKAAFTECMICLEWAELHMRACCGYSVCDDCIESYCAVQVQQRMVKIRCLNPLCTSYLSRDEILLRLKGADKRKFYRFLVDANKDPFIKTCPQCSYVYKMNPVVTTDDDEEELTDCGLFCLGGEQPKKEAATMVRCTECSLLWCFDCQAPWHEGIKCKDFQKGDKLVKQWAKKQYDGQVNAQKCPKCKVLIQRSSGCDHMTCNWCDTPFCYQCGGRYYDIRFIGNHYSKLSVLGCKYRFLPRHPIRRKVIRASVLGGTLMLAPVVGCVVVAVGAVVGTLVLPFYCTYKLHKKRTEKRKLVMSKSDFLAYHPRPTDKPPSYAHAIRQRGPTTLTTVADLHPSVGAAAGAVGGGSPTGSVGSGAVGAGGSHQHIDLSYWVEPESLPSSSDSDDDKCISTEVKVVAEANQYNSVWDSDNMTDSDKASRIVHTARCDVCVHLPNVNDTSSSSSAPSSTTPSVTGADDKVTCASVNDKASDSDSTAATKRQHSLDLPYIDGSVDVLVDNVDAIVDSYGSLDDTEDIHDSTIDTTYDTAIDDTDGYASASTVNINKRVLTASISSLALDDCSVVLHCEGDETWL